MKEFLQIDKTYIYAIVRRDLIPVQVVVQAAHATIEVARSGLIPENSDHPSLIICSVKDEEELISFSKILSDKNIIFKPFYEADLNDSLTAIATEPVPQAKRKHFKDLPLINQKDLSGGAK